MDPDNKDFVEEFLNGFDGESRYPEGFLQRFEPLECLAHNMAGETLLVRDRRTDRFSVAKCYEDASLLPKTTESELLRRLHHSGMPEFVDEFRSESMLCVVREYIDGTPLDRFAKDRALSQEQVVSIGVQLCDILGYLHAQNPPVIHRDIKPQNIIIDGAGKVRLIDFGISREYDPSSTGDTVCFGTKDFAAPEQYGFAQTDGRADIFSLGVLLCFLLTGETDVDAASGKIADPRLRKVVARCAAFDPNRRYASATKVRQALLRVDGTRRQRAAWLACAALACIASLCAGFAIGRYSEFAPAFLGSPDIAFSEPLVGQAVRLSLGAGEDEPLTETDLLGVIELYIYGNQAAADSEGFNQLGMHMVANDGVVRNGGLQSLQDLAKLKNLRRVEIALEDIEDVSPLAQIEGLEMIEIKHNPVGDVSPLAGMPSLRELYLYDTRVTDLTALAACPRLDSIDIGGTRITSLGALSGIDLKNLAAFDTKLDTLKGIEQFPGLETVRLSDVGDGDLTPLLSLPELKTAVLSESLRDAAQETLSGAKFEIIYQ